MSWRHLMWGQTAIVFLVTFFVVGLNVFENPPAYAQSETGDYVAPGNRLVVTAGALRNWPPHYSVDKSGNPGGFAIELMNEVASLANVGVVYRVYESFSLASAALQEKEIDLIPNMGIAGFRREYALFTEPLETFLVRVFVRSGTLTEQQRNADWLDVLKGRLTAVVVSNVGEHILAKESEVPTVLYKSIHEAVVDLIAGRADALVYPESVVHRITRSIGLSGKIEAVGTPLREIKRGIAIRNDYPELHERLSAAVEYFVGTKKYEDIYTRWFGAQGPYWTSRRLILFIGIPGGLILVVLVGWRYISVTNLNRRLVEGREVLAALNSELESRERERMQVMNSVDQTLTDLRHSQESLNRAQRIAHIGNWDWDIAGGTLTWSDEIYRIFGLKPQEFGATYEAFLEYIHPDDREPVAAAVRGCLEQRIPYSIEHRVIRPDGEERTVHEFGEVERDDTGAPIFMSGTVQDITRRKQADLALREARDRLEQKVEERTQELSAEKARAEGYLNIAGTIICAVDQDGNLLLLNRKGREVLGYEGENPVGRNWFDLAIPEEQRAEVRSVFGKILHGDLEPVESYENHIVTRSGERRLVAWHNTYLHDDQGSIVGTLSAGEDITDRRKADEALKDSERQLLKAQAIAGMGNWRWNFVDDSEVWSDQQFRIFGYEPGEVEPTYQLFVDAVHPDHRDEVLAAEKGAIKDDKPYNIDFRIVRADGAERYIEAQGEVERDAEGNPVAMVGTVLDITDRKAIELKLIESSKMATLGEMATGVAHELNQPLNVIRLAVSNIQRKLKKDTINPEYLVDKLDKVDQQVDRASGIIDHMRIFGRKPGSMPMPLDPGHMVDGTLSLIGEHLRLAGIEVTTEISEACHPVLGHQVQIEQVLLNLLGNARDALQKKEDGDRKIAISISERDDTVIIAVEDNGGGIPADVLPRVFEPFFTTKDVGSGTGLGLSISYGIIHDMGGTLSAENVETGADRAARFTIRLPVCDTDTATA